MRRREGVEERARPCGGVRPSTGEEGRAAAFVVVDRRPSTELRPNRHRGEGRDGRVSSRAAAAPPIVADGEFFFAVPRARGAPSLELRLHDADGFPALLRDPPREEDLLPLPRELRLRLAFVLRRHAHVQRLGAAPGAARSEPPARRAVLHLQTLPVRAALEPAVLRANRAELLLPRAALLLRLLLVAAAPLDIRELALEQVEAPALVRELARFTLLAVPTPRVRRVDEQLLLRP